MAADNINQNERVIYDVVKSEIFNSPAQKSTTPIYASCPRCLNYDETYVEYQSTRNTKLFSFILLIACCCWIPYTFPSHFQIAHHFCNSCKRYIASTQETCKIINSRNNLISNFSE